MNIIRSSRFRGVVCCSGAEREISFRYPNDIVNLGHILGFDDVAQSRECITSNPKSVLLHARESKKISKKLYIYFPFHLVARLKSFKSVVLDPKDLDDFHVGESYISV